MDSGLLIFFQHVIGFLWAAGCESDLLQASERKATERPVPNSLWTAFCFGSWIGIGASFLILCKRVLGIVSFIQCILNWSLLICGVSRLICGVSSADDDRGF